jgi:ABC-2 type transport system permease protein
MAPRKNAEADDEKDDAADERDEEEAKDSGRDSDDDDDRDEDEDDDDGDDGDDDDDDDEDEEEDDEDEDEKPSKSAKSSKSDDDDDDEDEEEDDEDEDEAPKKSASSTPTKVSPADGGDFMDSVRNVLTIAKRELRGYANSPAAYVVLCLSLLGLGLYFFIYEGGFWQADRVTVERLISKMPLALCVVIPVLTMGVLAEEKRSGTIELLITMPVKDSEVILGKFLAALGLCTILLAASFVYPVALFKFPGSLGPLDWGPVWTGYLGLFLYSGAGIALGMMFSSFTESQIIAFFATIASLLVLWGLGLLVDQVQGGMGVALSFISTQAQLKDFERGIIASRSIVYFLSIATICLLVSFRSLESRKWK